MKQEEKAAFAEKYKQVHPVPKRLAPEQIEKMLKRANKSSKGRAKRLAAVITSAAACIAVGAGGLIYSGGLGGDSEDSGLYHANKKDTDSSDSREIVQTASDYSDIAAKIWLNAKIRQGLGFYSADKAYETDDTAQENITNGESKTSVSESTDESTQDYSETYRQEKGVDEADIIKTDGENIYYIANDKLYFLRANHGKTELAYSETLDGNPIELYLNRDQLYVVCGSDMVETQSVTASTICGVGYEDGSTVVLCYDVSDLSKPKKIGEYAQAGSYQDSRMKDGFLYLITDWAVYSSDVDQEVPAQYIPSCSVNGREELVPAEDIQIGAGASDFYYTVIAGLDFTKESPQVSVKAAVGDSSAVYASVDSIYALQNTYTQGLLSSGMPQTQILRYAYDKGTLELAAAGKVNGSVLDQYACSAYDGSFRIATTGYDKKYTEQNYLYVLDLQLKKIGALENYGTGETIRSVNFNGETAYVVTFEQTDPLFAIDLSDKTAPKITDALKVTGYSSHLRAFGEGLLFGIGMEAGTDGFTTGVKASMFSVDDRENLTEAAREVFLNRDSTIDAGGKSGEISYYYCSAAYDANALLLDVEKNLIGFPLQRENFTDDGGNQTANAMYLLYRYDETRGFVKLTEISGGNWQAQFTRAVYIGQYLYVFSSDGVVTLDLTDYTETVRTEF